MKQFLLLMLVSGSALGQSISSVANGQASNPFVWSCTCIPSSSADVTINHAISMNSDWIVNGGGSITVNAGGSFIQDANRTLLIDGAGSQYIVHGVSTFENFAFTNGASGSNSGDFTVQTGLYFGPGTNFTNSGSMMNIDSLLIEGSLINSGNIGVGNLLITGSMDHSGNTIWSDSLGVTGQFNVSGGWIYANAFGNDGQVDLNAAPIFVTNNAYNAGKMYMTSGSYLEVGSSFYNGDLQNFDAMLDNDGLITVETDFANSDTLRGSGNLCVGQGTSNSGRVLETLNFCDNSGGGGFDLNIGTIAPTVTYCTPGCYLNLAEQSGTPDFYPNPSNGQLHVGQGIRDLQIFSLDGSMIRSYQPIDGLIEQLDLGTGIYILKYELTGETKTGKLVIE